VGIQQLSLKGDFWRGKTSQNTSDRGQRRFIQLENCYVSGDGSELRHWPGFSCILDLSEENNSLGYARHLTEAVRPIFQTSPSETYQYYYGGTDERAQSLTTRAKPTHLHWFEQVGDTLLIGGESRFRESPVYRTRTPGQLLVMVSVGDVGGKWTIVMSNSVVANSVSDATGPGLNGLNVANVVYIEGINVADATLQAAIDANLNGRMHEVKAISGSTVTLHTTTSVGIGLTAIGTMADPYLYRVSYNRTNVYSTPNGNDPYTDVLNNRPSDPDALTSWRVIDALSRTDADKPCFPAWVANRQRDFSDQITASIFEGIGVNSTGRGVSRREGRTLPYRMNPECATDRVIVAAPGYGCMFQVPLKVPTQPQFDFPFPSPGGDDVGPLAASNSLYDMPRSLGIPKGRLIDSYYTVPQPSPSQSGDYTFNLTLFAGSPEFAFPPGEYLIAIAYEDEALGEEGLASEPITVAIPANDWSYAPTIHYIHPGYIMPECLATKVNIYMAGPGEEAMAFYASFPLMDNSVGASIAHDTDARLSGVYGFNASISPDNFNSIKRTIILPTIGDGTTPTDVLDAERLAPQSASMPRGAEACRYVRGVLLAGGAMGNSGPSGQLWNGKASMRYQPAVGYDERDEMHIRVHGDDYEVPTEGMDGDAQSSTLGIGGRAFPDAYQGIEAISKTLWPVGSINQRIDRVVNRKTVSLTGASLNYERIRLSREVFDRVRDAGSSPNAVTALNTDKDIWYLMPKGQLQISDPGAPYRASKAAIKITDPKRGDDIVAIGDLAGTAIVCSRRETYSFAWYKNPGSEEPNLVHNEIGCIAANSMVEFDGGLAWLSARGPVAMGASLQFIGKDVEEDFTGANKRYLHDARGMMRHAFGAHDPSRSLVLWGLVTDETATIEWEGEDVTWANATDEQKSRFPCDEILAWNYRSNAFSTWVPPEGLEALWMRVLRDEAGEERLCFLAADGRIYAFDDAANDSAMTTTYAIEGTVTAKQLTATTTISFTLTGGTGVNGTVPTGHSGDRRHLRAGMLFEIIDTDNHVVAETTIASITTSSSTGATVVLSAAQTWGAGYTVRVGARQRATIVGTYIGAEAGVANLNVQGVTMRYSLHGNGTAHAKCSLLKLNFQQAASADKVKAMTPDDGWDYLGNAQIGEPADKRIGRRIDFKRGGADGTDIAVKLVVSGSAQTRIEDIALEVA
jgi:hypothetical protein